MSSGLGLSDLASLVGIGVIQDGGFHFCIFIYLRIPRFFWISIYHGYDFHTTNV